MESSINEISSYYTSGSQSSELGSTTEETTKADRQIVEVIFSEWYPSMKKDEIVIWADEAMGNADILSGNIFGSIISEDDVMEKAQAAWIELGWLNDVEDKETYKAEFYDEYDVWMVDSFYQQHGVDSQSTPYAVPGSGLCIIMRKTDGKVLAVWIS